MSRKLWTSISAALGMLILILDAQTALQAATIGLQVCIYTVIPALLPFFILSLMLTGSLVGENLPIIRPLGRMCGVPKGGESLLVVGMLGGYPAGAGCVAEAYRNGVLRKSDAQRMIAFCNLAGPAFLFGIVLGKLENIGGIWALWGIHIASAILVSLALPGRTTNSVSLPINENLSMTDILTRSLKIMASVCGWIIVFRVILAFMQRWFLWFLPLPLQIILTGGLELANGCLELYRITEPSVRFLITAWMLGFGGLCVFMQTASVTSGLSLSTYFWGKLLHALFSLLLAYFAQFVLYDNVRCTHIGIIFCIAITLLIALIVKFIHKKQKKV